jgi:hypothetical protein
VLTTGAFDKDGYAGVLASARKKLVVFPGSKTGLRADHAKVTSWPLTTPAMAAADFDGDGFGDAAVAGDKQVVVLRGSEHGLRVAGRHPQARPQAVPDRGQVVRARRALHVLLARAPCVAHRISPVGSPSVP